MKRGPRHRCCGHHRLAAGRQEFRDAGARQVADGRDAGDPGHGVEQLSILQHHER